jgi:isopentenyl-diphosphate Delta-isomerase
MNQANSQLIALVDQSDNIIGYDDKIKVHVEGTLHRAFSVFIFNNSGQMLIHQRALHKYHSPGLWTNACCSHLLQGFDMETCVHKRMMDEIGFDCPVTFRFKFTYKAEFDNGLTEHETDHVYSGIWNGNPLFNPEEVAQTKWVSHDWLLNDVKQNPQDYTYWFKYILEHFYENLT